MTNSPSGLMFVDNLGRVIFANSMCLLMLGHSNSGKVVGEPISVVFGIDFRTADRLIEDIRQQGKIGNRELLVRARGAQMLNLICSGAASYDHQRNFIGAELILQQVAEQPDVPSIVEADSIDQQSAAALAGYFVAQINGLKYLISQIVGKRYVEVFVNILNEAAERNQWPVHMTAATCQIKSNDVDPDVYRALLSRASSYVTKLVGKPMLANQIKQVNKQIPAETLEIIKDLSILNLI